MTMAYVSTNDLAPALRLKDEIGRNRVARLLSGQHPLATGFAALEKRLIGQTPLTLEENQELGGLLLAAQMIFETEEDWSQHRAHLISDLAKAHECSAILFELQVMRFALPGHVSGIAWRRYVEDSPDIICHQPLLAIECKLPRSGEVHRNTVFRQIEYAWHQHKDRTDAPLVVAVGFMHDLPDEKRALVEDECRNRGKWFSERHEIAAVLLFLPRAVEHPSLDALGVPRVQFMQGTMLEILNHSTSRPLPQHFTFGPKRNEVTSHDETR